LISILTLNAVVTGFDAGSLFGKPMTEMVFGVPRIFGTEQNPNAYAVYSCIGMILSVYAIIRARNGLLRTAAVLAGLAILAVLFLSASRSAAVGAAVGITVFLVIYVRGVGAKTACLGLGAVCVVAGIMLPTFVANTSDLIFKSFYLDRIASRVHAEIEEMKSDLTVHIETLEASASEADPEAQAELAQKRDDLERLSDNAAVEKIVENAVVYSRAAPSAEISSSELLTDKMLADLSEKEVRDASLMVADKVQAAENRLEILIYSARLIALHPIFGVGFLNARKAFVSADLPVDNAVHNTYVSVAVEFGLPAAALFVAALVLLAYRLLRSAMIIPESARSSRQVVILMPATLIGYMVHGTFHDSYMNVLLWLVIALSITWLGWLRAPGEHATEGSLRRAPAR
jgi:O-antigen ligase